MRRVGRQIHDVTAPAHGLSWVISGTAKAPENRPSQKETSIPTIHFQGLC